MNILKPLKPKPFSHCDEFKFIPRYTSTLPELPFPGKFLKCNMKSLEDRFSDYQATQLETRTKFTMCDLDVGVAIDLVDPKAYQPTDEEGNRHGQPELDPKDVYLLEDDSNESIRKLKRSAQHKTAVPFMRRTEYISSEFIKLGSGADRQETKIGYNLLKRKRTADEMFYRDRDAQLVAINRTFEDVKKPVTKHHSKPGVTAVEECYIFPDFEMLKYAIVDVVFDADPCYLEVPAELQLDCLKNSQLVTTDEGENSACLFCPPVETIQKLKEAEAGGELRETSYEYKLNREYTWQLKDKGDSTVDDEYALYQRGDTVYYCPLETHVKLTRRRPAAGEHKKLASLKITHRQWTEEELETMETRKKQYLNVYENEEDMQVEEGENKEEEAMDTGDGIMDESSSSTPSPSSDSD